MQQIQQKTIQCKKKRLKKRSKKSDCATYVSDKAEKKSVKIKTKESFQKILEETIYEPLKCLIKEQGQISAQGGNLSKINKVLN